MTALTLPPAAPSAATSRPASAAPAATAASLPWDLNDLLRVLVGNALMAVALLVAWFGISGTAVLDNAVKYTVVGIAGVVLQGCANIGWLMRGRRAIGERGARLVAELEALLGPELGGAEAAGADRAGGAVPASAAVLGADGLVTVPGTTRYHRRGCQLVAGKNVVAVDPANHISAGRTACGMCEP